MNAKLSLPDFAGPFDMDASAEWQGRQVSVVAHVDRPQAIAAGQETALRLTAEGVTCSRLISTAQPPPVRHRRARVA